MKEKEHAQVEYIRFFSYTFSKITGKIPTRYGNIQQIMTTQCTKK